MGENVAGLRKHIRTGQRDGFVDPTLPAAEAALVDLDGRAGLAPARAHGHGRRARAPRRRLRRHRLEHAVRARLGLTAPTARPSVGRHPPCPDTVYDQPSTAGGVANGRTDDGRIVAGRTGRAACRAGGAPPDVAATDPGRVPGRVRGGVRRPPAGDHRRAHADVPGRSTRGRPGWPTGSWRGASGPATTSACVLANYPEFVPLKFAIARAGAVAVPLNYLYRRDELAYVLAQSRCRTLVTMDRLRRARPPRACSTRSPRAGTRPDARRSPSCAT